MKIRELVHLMTSEWFKEYMQSSVIDTHEFELINPSITGDMEIEDSFKNIITIKKVENNSRRLNVYFGKLFTVEIFINKFPYEFAPMNLFNENILCRLLKIGWVRTFYVTMTLGQSGLKCALDRKMKMEKMVAYAIYCGNLDMLSTILNIDWHKLSYDFQSETHTFLKNDTIFQVYGEMSNDWIKDFVTEGFEEMMEDCQSRNLIEHAAVLLNWKKKNISDDKEETVVL